MTDLVTFSRPAAEKIKAFLHKSKAPNLSRGTFQSATQSFVAYLGDGNGQVVFWDEPSRSWEMATGGTCYLEQANKYELTVGDVYSSTLVSLRSEVPVYMSGETCGCINGSSSSSGFSTNCLEVIRVTVISSSVMLPQDLTRVGANTWRWDGHYDFCAGGYIASIILDTDAQSIEFIVFDIDANPVGGIATTPEVGSIFTETNVSATWTHSFGICEGPWFISAVGSCPSSSSSSGSSSGSTSESHSGSTSGSTSTSESTSTSGSTSTSTSTSGSTSTSPCDPITLTTEKGMCESGTFNVYANTISLNIVDGCLTKSESGYVLTRSEGSCGCCDGSTSGSTSTSGSGDGPTVTIGCCLSPVPATLTAMVTFHRAGPPATSVIVFSITWDPAWVDFNGNTGAFVGSSTCNGDAIQLEFSCQPPTDNFFVGVLSCGGVKRIAAMDTAICSPFFWDAIGTSGMTSNECCIGEGGVVTFIDIEVL